jgi:hypothetical protein
VHIFGSSSIAEVHAYSLRFFSRKQAAVYYRSASNVKMITLIDALVTHMQNSAQIPEKREDMQREREMLFKSNFSRFVSRKNLGDIPPRRTKSSRNSPKVNTRPF